MTGYSTLRWLTIGVVAGLGSVACGNQAGSGSSNGGSGASSGFSNSGSSTGAGSGSSGTQGASGTGAGSTGTQTGDQTGSGSGAGGAGTLGTSTGGASGSGSTGDDGGVEDAGGGTETMITPHMGNTCLKPVTDFTKKGPYTVTKSSVDLSSLHELPDAGPTTYSIFTPGPLDPNCRAPVVIWGNGTGVTGSSMTVPAGACTGMSTLDCLSGTYDFFNVYAASFGIVVVASDNSNVGSGLYHKAAADYMNKQNADPSSPFYQKLSGRIGVSGHSQGGIGATSENIELDE